jgi:hypothetical protein
MTAYFIFDENENLVTERIYFDQLSVLKQLISGIDRRRPSGLRKLLQVLRGMLAMSGGQPDPRLTSTTAPDL